MREKAEGAWLTLNTTYYAAVAGNPLSLLDDADNLLHHAHGVVRLMRDALQLSPCVDKDALTQSLKAVEVLMQMSAGSPEAAYVRFVSIGDGWIGSQHTADA
jgi:hypothetical protein